MEIGFWNPKTLDVDFFDNGLFRKYNFPGFGGGKIHYKLGAGDCNPNVKFSQTSAFLAKLRISRTCDLTAAKNGCFASHSSVSLHSLN